MQPLNTISFDAIGSRFWLEDLTGAAFNTAALQAVLRYVEQFSQAYSRFREDSLVAELARAGALNNPPAELLKLLNISKQMYDATEGTFNITVGAALHAMGYGSAKHAGKVLADPWRQISWTDDIVQLPRGLMLDFGGLGKGWLIDKIAEILRAHGMRQFIVNGGGDLYVQNTIPIEFALEDPQNSGRVLRTVKIQRGALAGSNTIKRSWDTATGRKHHIVDPKTQDSSDSGILASYVIADTALVADIMATVLIISPSLKERLEKQYAFTSLLISAETQATVTS